MQDVRASPTIRETQTIPEIPTPFRHRTKTRLTTRIPHPRDEQAKTYENCIDMNTPGMIRVSFGIYNNEAEVDEFLKVLESVLDASRLATKADELAIPAY